MTPEPSSRRATRLAEKQAGAIRRRNRRTVGLSVLAVAVLAVPGALVAGTALAGTSEITVAPGRSAVGEVSSPLLDGSRVASFTLNGRPAGAPLYLGVELRRSGGALYRAKVAVAPEGGLSVGLGKVVGGPEQILGSRAAAGAVPVTGGTVKVQGLTQGSTVAVRAWVDGSAVPAWQFLVTDSDVSSAGGARSWAYLSARATAPVTLTREDLASGEGTAPAPEPQPTQPTVPTQPVPPKPTTPAPVPPKPDPVDPKPEPEVPASAGLAAVLGAAGAAATTNYTAPAGAVHASPNGSDSASGSAASPLRTVRAAIAKAPAGGTVVLRGGTYREAVGDVNKPVTLQAYPGEKPVISGADLVGDWTASGGAWRTTSWRSPFSQNQFRPDEVASGSAAGLVEQVFRNGTALKQVLGRGELKSGTFWLDPSSKAVYVADNPAGAALEVSSRDRALTLNAGAAGSKILGLRFTAFATPHLDNSGALYVSSPRTLIEHSTFDHNSGAGVKIAAANLTVNRVTVRDNGAEGMQGNRNDNSVVRNSVFRDNNAAGFKSVGCGAYCTLAGFKTAHTDNLQVINNAFVDNDSNGFWCDLGCTNVKITNNAVRGGLSGIYYEVSSRGTISGNYVENTERGIKISGSDRVTVSGNTLKHNGWQMTVYDDTRSPSSDSYSASKGLSWNTTQLVVKDNTFVGGAGTEFLLAANATHQVASPQMYAQTVDNEYSGNQDMVWCPSNGNCRAYDSVAAWKAAANLDF